MIEGPVSIFELLFAQIQMLIVTLPVGLITLWLLRTRWLRHIDPQPFPRTNLLRQIGIGTATALVALTVAVIPGQIAGSFSAAAPGWDAFDYQVIRDAFATVGGLALLFAIQSLFEEVLFRAIGVALLAMLLLKVAEVLLLPKDYWKFGSSLSTAEGPVMQSWRLRAWFFAGLLANLVLSIGFALVHGWNPGVSPFALLNITLAGMWLGLLFWRRLSLSAAWLGHYVWNLGLSLLGLPISGMAFYQDPLGEFGIDGARPDLLSGGEFGPEAALPATLVLAALCVALFLLMLREQRAATAAVRDAADSGLPAAQAG